MKNLVFLQGDQPIITSLKVAQTFGKNHRDVMRDIRNLEKQMAKKSLSLPTKSRVFRLLKLSKTF